MGGGGWESGQGNSRREILTVQQDVGESTSRDVVSWEGRQGE